MNGFNQRKYYTTVKLIFLKSVSDIFPNARVEMKNSLNNGVYGEIILKDKKLNKKDFEKIKEKMENIISQKLPINLVCDSDEKLKRHINKINREDIKLLLSNSIYTGIVEYSLDGYIDYFYEEPYSNTKDVKVFDLYKYNNGFILKTPKFSADLLGEMIDNTKLAGIFEQTRNFNKILKVSTVGDVNEKVMKNEIETLIRVNEALHEKNLTNISERVSSNSDIKIIAIAGPSSSGKTTFSKKLEIHLIANELNPVLISLDNYYIGRKNIPLDENGKKDFESIEGLDIKLLSKNLEELIAGKETELPLYDFITGERKAKGKKLKLSKNSIIILEGIHGLNEKLTATIPKKHKIKIYISCLTQLNIDMHNRVYTSDVRKIRRIVRDRLSRETSVEETMAMWSSVRDGEEKNIFPFQEEADILFNSNLVYELGVLKPYALKELIKVKINSKYYKEARRLIKLLSPFLDIDSELVPDDSLLKEFIGKSFFYNY